jgi:hypothetical protein
LQQGKNVANDLMGLESLFRPSVQPFLKTWMALNPAKEIKKLNNQLLHLNLKITKSNENDKVELEKLKDLIKI